MRTKHTMTILVMILVFALAMTACGSEKAPETTEAATVATTVATAAPTETTAPPQPLTLSSWTMSASTWSSPNGATIHISATPSHYSEAQKADFLVRVDTEEIASIPCQWDGANYTASADLNADNGYSYYVVLTDADGSVEEFAVNTPEAPTNEAFINMKDSLESYCSVVIEESNFGDNQLTLTAGKAQVKAPAITNEGEVISCQEAALILSLDAEELAKVALTMNPTATTGLLEADLNGIVFDIPEMEDYQKLELTLNAVLTNGQILSAYGGNWQASAEGLLPVLG